MCIQSIKRYLGKLACFSIAAVWTTFCCCLSLQAQEIRPFYTKEESVFKCTMDSLYAAKATDSAISLMQHMLDMNSLFKEDYTVYLNLYYCYKFQKTSMDDIAFSYLSKSIDRGLRLSYGYDLIWFLTFDTTRNRILKERLISGKENTDSLLLKKITGIWEKGQEWRTIPDAVTDSLKHKGLYTQFIREARRSDSINTMEVKRIIHLYGWQGLAQIGLQGDGYLWNIVQHADDDIGFQLYVLELLRSNLMLHNTNPRNFAYLYDRIKVNQGLPQLYGTQFADTVIHNDVNDYKIALWPLSDPAHLEYYRKAMGLNTAKEYIQEMKSHIKEGNRNTH